MFEIVTYSPLHLQHTAIAQATVKADGIALFDLSYCHESALSKANENLRQFLSKVNPDARTGVKIPEHKLELFQSILSLLSNHNSRPIVVISELKREEEFQMPSFIAQSTFEFWAEVCDSGQKDFFQSMVFSALVLKGSENGGVIGEENSFVLAQSFLAEARKPVYVQGSMGFSTGAACIAAGATGLVLDDQLLGLAESALLPYKHVTEQLEAVNTSVGPINGSKERSAAHPAFSKAVETGWGNPNEYKWPIGQAIGLAGKWASSYRTIGRLFKVIRSRVKDNVKTAIALEALKPNGPLAEAHGTKYPIVQGPMTRVSDRSKFIYEVATAGALPFLALSMMSGAPMKSLLEETKQRLGEKPWGVGILGFVPEDLRQEQLSAIKENKPQFALVAGGTVDQVMELEKVGVETYLHAPTVGLLNIFLGRGCKRFVLEGRECGGHVGPLGSFTLWESVIERLLELPDEEAKGIQVLFAGGIHNAQSSMMVAAMTGSLSAKGVKVGVLMGTAYLFTIEVCTSGAVLEGFQKAALDCNKTSVIETGPGHAIRCIPTPFVDEFNAYKTSENKRMPASELSSELEKMTLGRLRIASKGKERTNDGTLENLPDKEQYRKGMYMVGQVANMHEEVLTMKALHQQVSIGGNAGLKALKNNNSSEVPSDLKPSSIAVVGMSTILPGAKEVDDFWELVLSYQKVLTEVPEDRWDWKLYYDKDLKTRDKIVSKWGGFIDDLLFDPLKYGIPPHSLKSISPAQLILLEAVDKALQHAGYENGDFDREHTSIIVGSDGTSALKNQYAARTMLPQFIDLLSEEDLDRLPEWNEESFAGVLTNVLAGRVANRFNLGGANFSVDAACASSLTAVDLAIKELEGGNSNMVIAAGIDIAQSPFSYTAFSKTQALSPTGESIPFDEKANGIVISEGVGVVLLKKLEDAERDGDTIYCVLKGSACSSDGKGLGLTAPRSSGQERAFARAYKKAGFSPASIGYYEAHATGTSVGDKVELQSVSNVLMASNAEENACALGSVKSLVGHTKTSAGVVGLVKTAFSLYHQTLSPHQIKTKPLGLLQDFSSPVCLLQAPKPWYTTSGTPRRAGISAFGFGGTNTHVVLEEYNGNNRQAPNGSKNLPAELFLFAAATVEELSRTLEKWTKKMPQLTGLPLRELAYVACSESKKKDETAVRLAIVARNSDELLSYLKKSLDGLKSNTATVLPPQVSLSKEAKRTKGKMAFLFPGQGAQHLQMARENAVYFRQLRRAIDQAHSILNTEVPLGALMYPETAFTTERQETQRKRLTSTEHAQPAIGTISLGYLQFLQDLGLVPDAVAGHSYGEFTALYAGGMISRDDFLRISEKRGALMSRGCEIDGTMAVVKAGPDAIEPLLSGSGVSIANLNAPNQTVLSGERKALLDMVERLKSEGFKAQEIEVAGPFHTQYFKAAQKPLKEAISALELSAAKRDVYSNSTARKYPSSDRKVKELLGSHLLNPVKFSDQISSMHEDGVRLFVEVGPKQILTGLVGQILGEKEHRSIAVEGFGGGVKGLLTAVAQIFTEGYEIDPTCLFENRVSYYHSLEALLSSSQKTKASKAAVWINGAGVRAPGETKPQTGKLPVLTHSERKEVTNVAGIQKQQVRSNDMSQKQFSEQSLLEGYQAYQKTMQQFLTTQEAMVEKFFSMETGTSDNREDQIVQLPVAPKLESNSKMLEEQKTDVIEQEVSMSDQQESSESKAVSREAIAAKMMDIICERTGYPKDMIATNVDLEAELGIDSIKRIEILDKILKELPVAHEEQLQGQMQPLMRTKTIDAFLDIAFAPSLSLNAVEEGE